MLVRNGYIIKRFSTDGMTKSNRFNPLFYIWTTSDILVIVNVLLENTQEGANSIIGNCDTTIFLGGSDSDTLKIICDRLGKETVKTLSFGQPKGKMSSVSTNKQDAARELMSRIQMEQMSNTECLVFIRALRPFKVKKYNLEEHPNYKYTAETDSRYLRKAEYCLEYNDEEIEAVRVKAVGEDGYIKPLIVDSAGRHAQEVERKKKAEAEKAQEKANLQISDETKTKEQMAKELAEKKTFPHRIRRRSWKG